MTAHSSQQHVLITQGFLYNLAGSETVAFEVAEHFSRQGFIVTVAVHGFGEPWNEEFSRLPRTELFEIDDPALEERLQQMPPDLAWIQHQLVPESVLRHAPPIVIFNQMSGAHPLEFPYSIDVVRALASLVTFNAAEISKIQRATGILEGLPDHKLAIFGNPAPDAFAHTPPAVTSLDRLLVVSNHIPSELDEALETLHNQHGTTVVRLGLEEAKNAQPIRVTPELLREFDAVVTIGKTVQYSVVSGIPVYCYDRFGGPGWLNPSNFAQAQEYNFSGRSFSQKSASEIASEIWQGHQQSQHDAHTLHASVGNSLTITTKMNLLLTQAQAYDRSTTPLDEVHIQGHLRAQQSIGNYARIAASVEQHLADVEADRKRIVEHLEQVHASRSFRFAQFLSRRTTGARKLLRFFHQTATTPTN